MITALSDIIGPSGKKRVVFAVISGENGWPLLLDSEEKAIYDEKSRAVI